MLSVEAQQALHAGLSQPRLSTYLLATKQDLSAALHLYTWNQQASAAFFEVLGVVEVVLRNAIHRELTAHLGHRWWDSPGVFDERTDNHFAAARHQVAREGLNPATVPPDKLLSHMTFGTWVALLDAGGRPSGGGQKLDHDQGLWRPSLHRAFPHRSWKRREAHQRCQRLQRLRNRIAHHEPIYLGVRPPGNAGAPFIDLSKLLESAFEMVDAVNPHIGDWLTQCNGAQRILLTRPDA